jgi:hypothetical protein
MRYQDAGQVSIDFLTGITVFLLALLFMLNFVTSTIVPFTNDGGVNSATVERASDRLYTDLLTSEDKPRGVLNETVTQDYFNNRNEEDMKRDLGIEAARSLNITITNASSGDIYDIGGDDLTAGDPLPDGGAFDSTSRIRVAYLEGTVNSDNETVSLNVRVR